MLEFNSPEWEAVSSNALLTAQLLSRLKNGDDSEWAELYHQLCHQNTVSKIAYVAVPHLVSIAQNTATIQLRSLLLGTIGSIVASRKCYPHSAAKLTDEWKTDFIQACDEARILAAETLKLAELDPIDSFELISALAALHGHSNITLLLESGPEIYCPECGENIVFGEDT
jgi:hypothetical protein